MPKTGHRITKHQMKADSFVTLAFRAQEYIQHHQKYFIAGLVAVVVIVAGAWLWSSAGQRAELSAEAEMGAAFNRIQQQDMAGAAAVYEGIIEDYPGTSAAREALFYLANLYFVEDKWQQSIDAYDRWVRRHGGGDAPRKAAAFAAMGDAYRQLGDYDQSLAYYNKALNVDGGRFLLGDVLSSAARAALMKGDTTQAVSFADQLFDEVGNTPSMIKMRELLALHGVLYTRGL